MGRPEFGPADHHPAEYDALTDWLAERDEYDDYPDPDEFRS